MIFSSTLTRALALPCLVAPLLVSIQDSNGVDASDDAARAEREESPTHAAMEELQSAMRKLRRMLRDPDQAPATIELLRAMQKNALITFDHSPEPPEGMPESEIEPFHVEYRRRILRLADEMCACELAVLEGRTEDARASFKQLTELKNEGHERFQIEEE